MAATFQILETLDSPERSEICRQNLLFSRDEARALGVTAVDATKAGTYQNSCGTKVQFRDSVERAMALRISIPPDHPLPPPQQKSHPVTTIQVSNESTMVAARRLSNSGLNPLALNFANGISPDGGFFHGALAQEECLCRSSALYHTLEGDPMYAYHLGRPLPDSCDWCILSSEVQLRESVERAMVLRFFLSECKHGKKINTTNHP